MVMKGPSGGQDIYDTPASSEKNPQQMVRISIWELSCNITILLSFCNCLMLCFCVYVIRYDIIIGNVPPLHRQGNNFGSLITCSRRAVHFCSIQLNKVACTSLRLAVSAAELSAELSPVCVFRQVVLQTLLFTTVVPLKHNMVNNR